MRRYFLQRLLLLIPLLIGVSLITFIIIHLAPGDPVTVRFGFSTNEVDKESLERVRDELGLNDPLPMQYFRYLKDLFRGDLGKSLTTKTPVSYEILSRLPATIELTLATMIIVVLIALPLGILSAVKKGSLFDRLFFCLSLVGVSMPSFLLGTILLLVFSMKLGWFPSFGYSGSSIYTLKALFLPAITLGMGLIGLVSRVIRSSMLDVLKQDYIRTAYAKGASFFQTLVYHALRNALIPVLTILGEQTANLLGGAVVVETIFAWPGIGRLAINAIWRRDYPLIIGVVLFFSLIYILINLIIDIFYIFINPRIRYGKINV